jgi:hypothetical protein
VNLYQKQTNGFQHTHNLQFAVAMATPGITLPLTLLLTATIPANPNVFLMSYFYIKAKLQKKSTERYKK